MLMSSKDKRRFGIGKTLVKFNVGHFKGSFSHQARFSDETWLTRVCFLILRNFPFKGENPEWQPQLLPLTRKLVTKEGTFYSLSSFHTHWYRHRQFSKLAQRSYS